MILVVILTIYFSYFAPSAELGLFSKFSSGSEINQRINVEIVKNKKSEKIMMEVFSLFMQGIKTMLKFEYLFMNRYQMKY